MANLITIIEEFSVKLGPYYPALCAFVIFVSVLIAFNSHKIRKPMSILVGALVGAGAGVLIRSVVLVRAEIPAVPALIALAVCALLGIVCYRSPMVFDAVTAFMPPAFVVGYLIYSLSSSMGVSVFVALVVGSVFAVVGVKVGRYFFICMNAIAASAVAIIALLSGLEILSKLYEMHMLLVLLPMLLLAAGSIGYQISKNPERLAEIEAKKAAADAELLRQFEVTPMWNCASCKTNNRVGEMYCKVCGKTETVPEKPMGLPETTNPGWRCACGRINNLSDGKCKGTNPEGGKCEHTIGEVMEWACSCGVRNGKTSNMCNACGQTRYQPHARAYVNPSMDKGKKAAPATR